MRYLSLHYPQLLKDRYQLEIDLENENWIVDAFDHIAKVRKNQTFEGETDYDRVMKFSSVKLMMVVLEKSLGGSFMCERLKFEQQAYD